MSRRLKRWTAVIALAVLAFAQANLAAAACEMDRRALAQVMIAGAEQACECEVGSVSDVPSSTNRCVAHCTADLQIAGMAAAIVRGASESSILQVPRSTRQLSIRVNRDAPPSAAVPIRILLHSFLI